MDEPVGHKIWVIPEGYIPGKSTGPSPEFTSHETACILNAGDTEANIEITIYFTDKDPVGPYKIKLAARRSIHLRFNDLKEPEEIPEIRIMQVFSDRMFRWWYNIHGSTPGRQKMPC
jgi:hypothetical protein